MIPVDKLLHFLVGAVIAFIVTPLTNPVAGVCAALAAGAAKEWLWDAWLKRGDFEALDLVATVSGGVFVLIVTAIQLEIGRLV